MFTDLHNKLKTFRDLDYETQQSLLKEIHSRASSQKEVFQDYLSKVNYGTFSHREIFYEAIRKKHYDCFLNENTALPMLKEGDFEFVVTDWNMPIMQGIDLLKEIRKDPFANFGFLI